MAPPHGRVIKWMPPADFLEEWLKMCRPSALPRGVFRWGEVELHSEGRTVYLNRVRLALTRKEYEVFAVFMLNPHQVFTKEEILERFWGPDFVTATKVVDVYVKNICAKLGKEIIRTVGTLEYCLATDPSSEHFQKYLSKRLSDLD